MKLNKTNIITLLALGGLLALSPALRADDTNSVSATPPATEGHAKHAARGGMKAEIKKLDLTPEQQPKFKAALQDMAKKLKDLRADTSLTPADRRAKVKEIRQETNETMKTILTPEQYEKWLKMSAGAKRAHKKSKSTDTN